MVEAELGSLVPTSMVLTSRLVCLNSEPPQPLGCPTSARASTLEASTFLLPLNKGGIPRRSPLLPP